MSKVREQLRIAVIIKNAGFLRYIETQIDGLCAQGHAVHIAVQDAPVTDDDGLLHELAQRWPAISLGYAVPRRDDWNAFARDLRGTMDFCRYLHPDYAHAIELRKRIRGAGGAMGRRVDALARALGAERSPAIARALMATLRSLHDSIPASAGIVAYLRELDIDLLLVTGLVWQQSAQADYIVAARQLRIPTGYIVNSWDNLTNKGDIKTQPDAIYVWNAEQAREAVAHHGVRPDAVRITGAPLFDRWFERRATRRRAKFLRRIGLPDERPTILYTCSSQAIAPDRSELNFFKTWLRGLRSSPSPALREANVILRPHPSNVAIWKELDVEDSRLAVNPRHGRWTVRESDRDDYFHALRYAAVVVGINTSAMLEAAILGAQTLSIRSGRFAAMQEGTLHFHHLTSIGIVDIHGQLADHYAALEAVLAQPDDDERRPLPGVIGFVRPQGVDQSSTALAVSLMVKQAREGRSRASFPAWRPFLRAWMEIRLLIGLIGGTSSSDKRPKTDLFNLSAQPSRLQRFYGRHIFPRLITNALRMLPSAGLRDLVLEGVAAGEQDRINEVESALVKAMGTDQPIFVGPWVGEVGFEVLYWIPFLRWFRKHAKIDRSRLVVISRGGVQGWYSSVAGSYFDVLDVYSPEEFRDRTLERTVELGHQKQSGLSQMDREIYAAVAERLGVADGGYAVIHPSTMNRLFSRYWKGVAGSNFVDRYTRFEPIPVKPLKLAKIVRDLPKRYVAVKFYFRESFPDTPQNRRFIAELLATMSRSIDVVVLASRSQIDDHSDFRSEGGHRLHWVDPMENPSTNLEVQTYVLAGAQGFVGTYGGLSYVANLVGKTSICFEELPAFNRPMHTELAMRKLRPMGGRLYVLDLQDRAFFGALFDEMARAQPAPLQQDLRLPEAAILRGTR